MGLTRRSSIFSEGKPLDVRGREATLLSSRLDSLALLSTFLASVQASTLQISFPNNSTRLQIATNALSFAGLVLDILATAGCLYVSSTLRSAALGLGYLGDIQAILEPPEEAPADRALTDYERRNVVILRSELIKALQSIRFTQAVAQANTVAEMVICGTVCLAVSVLCLSIANQPRTVWITAVAMVGLVLVLFLYHTLLAPMIKQPGSLGSDPLGSFHSESTKLEWLVRVAGGGDTQDLPQSLQFVHEGIGGDVPRLSDTSINYPPDSVI